MAKKKPAKIPVDIKPLYLLDDEPIAGWAEDKLDLARFADVVVGAALGTTGPFTIGVYAGWGQGKTSLLRQVHDLLKDAERYPRIVSLIFNAWRYEREPHPIIPLVATVERAVRERLEADKSVLEKAGDRALKLFDNVQRSLRGLAAGLTLSAKGDVNVPFVGKVELGAEWSAKDAVEREEALRKQAEEAERTQWDEWVRRCLHLAAFDRLDAVSDEVFGGDDERPEQLPRIVVLIDDLDRCLPERAFELLESIKLVLAQKGFVFVLALHREVLDAYLTREAARRYGEEQKSLGARYLDKIVQLPLPLPSHKGRFEDFVGKVIESRLATVLLGPETELFRDLAKLLAKGTEHTPRTLIRRINTLLVDMRLRAGLKLRGALGEEEAPYPEFLGLCLVQRTLQERLDPFLLLRLGDDQELCELLARHGVAAARRWLAEAEPGARGGRGPSKREGEWPEPPDSEKHGLWLRIVNGLHEQSILGGLLAEDVGRRWLKDLQARRAVTDFVSERPEAPASEAVRGAAAAPDQRALIERAIRGSLSLPAEAPLSVEAMAAVKELDFAGQPVTDESLEILARKDTGLKALTTLTLWDTPITDKGLEALARADTGLKALTTLHLWGTQITEKGLEILARADTGLKALKELYIGFTGITDTGLEALARADTGLKRLGEVHLLGTNTTAEGRAALRRARPELRMLE